MLTLLAAMFYTFAGQSPDLGRVEWTFRVVDVNWTDQWWYGAYGDYIGPGGDYFMAEHVSGHGLRVAGADPEYRSWLRYGCQDLVYRCPNELGGFLVASEYPLMNPNYIHVSYGVGVLLEDLVVGHQSWGHSFADDRYGPGASGLLAQTDIFAMTLTRVADTDPDGGDVHAPEPTTLAMILVGLVATGKLGRRR